MDALTGQSLLLGFAGLAVGAGIDAGAVRYARLVLPDESADEPGGRATWIPRVLTAVAGAVVAVLACLFTPQDMWVFSALLGWLLLALAAVDLRTFLLPDRLNAAVLALGLLMVALRRPDDWLMHLAGGAIGFGLLWGIEAAYRQLRGRDGLGRGDAKLLGAAGVWVGAAGLPPVLLVASLSGLVAALVMAALRGTSLAGGTAIAFGPWIALGAYAVWLAQAAGLLY